MTLVNDIEIHVDHDTGGRMYQVICEIKVKITSSLWAFARRERSIDDVNQRLRERAIEVGANAVIDVTYDRGMSWTSWKALTARGTAIRF